jgi:16S rRNA processing protein RimM
LDAVGGLELGRISGVFGVRGEVRLHLHNRETDLLDAGRDVILVAPDGKRFLAWMATRPGAGKRVLAAVDGIGDRDEALALIDYTLVLPRDVLPEPDPDEYYLEEIVGMRVCTGDRVHGRVVEVHLTGPIEVLELDTGAYLPSTGEHILGIDRAERVIEVAEGAVHAL